MSLYKYKVTFYYAEEDRKFRRLIYANSYNGAVKISMYEAEKYGPSEEVIVVDVQPVKKVGAK